MEEWQQDHAMCQQMREQQDHANVEEWQHQQWLAEGPQSEPSSSCAGFHIHHQGT